MKKMLTVAAALLAVSYSTQSLADSCEQLPSYQTLQTHLRTVVPANGGFNGPNGG